jgi:hypothetical protein
MVGHLWTPWWRKGWDGKDTPGPVACRPCFFVDRRLIEAGSRWVDGEWIRPNPGNFRVRHSSWSPSRGSVAEQCTTWRVQWQVFTAHPGMGSKKWDLTLVLLPCWRRCSHGGRKWLAVALNALTFVWELVGEAGRPARPRVVRVGDFPMVEASRRASSRASQNVVEAFCAWFWLVLPTWAEPLAWFSQGFVFFSRWVWVPLV